jgi:hypothetical protein
VHERGAPHVVDPAKLVKSATRLYGDRMERLWGEIVPVPAENLRILGDAETVDQWRVEYTPGHAVASRQLPAHAVGHRVLRRRRRRADHRRGPVLAPTPPPDIDLALWDASIDRIAAWSPSRLVLTHFGMHDQPESTWPSCATGWGG